MLIIKATNGDADAQYNAAVKEILSIELGAMAPGIKAVGQVGAGGSRGRHVGGGMHGARRRRWHDVRQSEWLGGAMGPVARWQPVAGSGTRWRWSAGAASSPGSRVILDAPYGSMAGGDGRRSGQRPVCG